MKLSAPIHVLKSQAKELKRSHFISMMEALNLIAKREGYSSWSLLQSKINEIYPTSYKKILNFFKPGDLVLIGGRPSIGKTNFSIGLFVQAIKETGAKAYLFTLSDIHRDIARRIASYDESLGQNSGKFLLDYSNEINAKYIINKTQSDISTNSVILVDYLQLLDHKRSNPPLQDQVNELEAFAKEKNCIIIFISQIDREIEYRADKRPTLDDVRLINPLQLDPFNKIIFLHREPNQIKKVEVIFWKPRQHRLEVGWNAEENRFF